LRKGRERRIDLLHLADEHGIDGEAGAIELLE
jgi:hypothetical protein